MWPSVLAGQKPLSKEVDDLNLMGSRLGKATDPHHFKKLTQLKQRPCGRRRIDLFNIEEHKAYVDVKGGGVSDCWKKMKLTASLKTSLGQEVPTDCTQVRPPALQVSRQSAFLTRCG